MGSDEKNDAIIESVKSKDEIKKEKKHMHKKQSPDAIEAVKELSFEIKSLEAALQVIAAQISKGISRKLATALRTIEENGFENRKKTLRMLKRIRSRKIKPHKGRNKDLKRIEWIADYLTEKLGL